MKIDLHELLQQSLLHVQKHMSLLLSFVFQLNFNSQSLIY